ncbi:MAG: agmatinase [Desulfurococcales archaeon]|nr:agmatinase [Desulfurococcales archaeon]
MTYRALYTGRGECYFGPHREAENPLYSILGVPLDSTSSYRTGQRFAPCEVRRASYNIEWNSMLVEGAYLYDVPIEDMGDLAVVHGDPHTTLDRLSSLIQEVSSEGKIPVVIGGEHTITYGVVKGLVDSTGRRPCIVVFDAHFDLRREYLGASTSHATVMRRIYDRSMAELLYYVGVRAWEREELDYARGRKGIYYATSLSVKRIGPANVAAELRGTLSSCDSIYVSIDMDVFDPAYAPGVANPEALGINPVEAATILYELASDNRLAGIDLVEVAPPYDPSGATSILASRLLAETIIINNLVRRGESIPRILY